MFCRSNLLFGIVEANFLSIFFRSKQMSMMLDLAPGGQIWSRLPPIGPRGLESWSPHTLTWYRAPSRSPGGQKRAFWPRSLNFHGPISWATFFCFTNRLVGCPEHRSGMPCSSSTVIAHMENNKKTNQMGQNTPYLAQLRFQTA